jgi:hypothetical protein
MTDWELSRQWSDYRRCLRSFRRWRDPTPDKRPSLVAREVGIKRTFSKILAELLAERDALRPDVRRLVVKTLRQRAQKRWKALRSSFGRRRRRRRSWAVSPTSWTS